MGPGKLPERSSRQLNCLHRRLFQEFAASVACEKRFYFAAQFGICLGQKCGALLGSALARRVVKLFDLLESLRGHSLGSRRGPGIFPILWLNSRSSHALAISQSRLTVRGETLSAATISSSVNPPK